MGIGDYKVKSEDFNNKDIMGLPDKPSEAGFSAEMLKARFDAGAKNVLAPKLNALIDFLSSSGAGGIGASVPGLEGNTVEELLISEKEYIDTHKADKENPHEVTKKQIGLENVENVQALPLENVKTVVNNSDEEVPTSAAILDYFVKIGGGDMLKDIYDPMAENKDVFSHERRTDNPHEVTAAQVGAATPADLAGYLPLSGGTLIGNLFIAPHNNGIMELYTDSFAAAIGSRKEADSDKRYIMIYNKDAANLNGAISLREYNGASAIDYYIYGQHFMCNDGAGPHNATYRGKALGSAVTAEQWTAIANGSFADLYIGDYWTIGGINYRIAAFDYYLRSGDTDMTTHHVTLVPDTSMYNHIMNDTNITDGAYIGSKMYAEGLAQAKTTINNAFGAAHILTHRRYLQNAVTNGYSNGGAWYDSTVELMTEQNVYGCRTFGNAMNGTGRPNLYTNDKSQYPLFVMRPDMISNRQTYWLRDVASASRFCAVGGDGRANALDASDSHGVRPAFSIKS